MNAPNTIAAVIAGDNELLKINHYLDMKYPNGIGMPESYTVEVDGVAPPYSYEITIKAYNCLNRASSALKGEFKTEGFCEIITQAEASAK